MINTEAKKETVELASPDALVKLINNLPVGEANGETIVTIRIECSGESAAGGDAENG